MTMQNLPTIEAMHAADRARAAYAATGYHGTDEYVDVLEQLVSSVRANLSTDKAHERASGYAAGREDASGVKTLPAPGSWRGPDAGWLDYAEAFAQAQDDYNAGQRGSMTNCKAAYERWTETSGRTVNDEMDERAAAIRAARKPALACTYDAEGNLDGAYLDHGPASDVADDVADAAALSRTESSACDH